MQRKKRILIIHGHQSYPLKASVRDLLFCYKNYMDDALCFYLNLNDAFDIPKYILKTDFDLVVFHTIFLSARWNGTEFFNEKVIKKCLPLKKFNCPKVILPQDEWIHTEALNNFVNELAITHVGSVAPPSEWKKIYNRVDQGKIKFHQFLTGYLDEKTLETVSTAQKNRSERKFDIGYRAFRSPAWLGRHGYLKTKIAEVFLEEGQKAGFKTNISVKHEDVITGNDWFGFLGDCRFFIGVEGGSTVIDPEGEIWKKGEKFVNENTGATFEEIEKNVFPGMDGNLGLIAISPRHLEAVATKTCQVLVEGSYNNILEANKHYIPVKRDFSNLDEVFGKMRDKELCSKMVDTAYADIVASGRFGYRQFLKEFVGFAMN